MDLNAVSKDIERVIVSEEDLQKRVKELAAQVDTAYDVKDLLLIGVLKGAVMSRSRSLRIRTTPLDFVPEP